MIYICIITSIILLSGGFYLGRVYELARILDHSDKNNPIFIAGKYYTVIESLKYAITEMYAKPIAEICRAYSNMDTEVDSGELKLMSIHASELAIHLNGKMPELRIEGDKMSIIDADSMEILCGPWSANIKTDVWANHCVHTCPASILPILDFIHKVRDELESIEYPSGY